ncbi:outer membrane protein [Roseinatronobacter sp.]|uniref:outer membrane protein n=1 Tax=Roseinatronobacter sp. TaxID=1945755 RepID=UPI0025FB8E32|nr:outer membrane beta-barrel protein [Roseibaca sp.]
MKLLSTASILGIALASAPAFADDHKTAYTSPAPAASSIRDWSGAYVGLGLSYSMGSYSTGGTAYQAPDGSGAGLSVILGYSWQEGAFVYGAEVMGNLDNVDGTGAGCGLGAPTTCGSNVDDYLAARVRVGYAFDNTLIFTTLGVASDRQWQRVYNAGGGIIGEDSARHTGVSIGLGVEQAINDKLSVRGDLEYVHYKSETYNFVAPGATTVRPSTTTARISLVNRF